MSQADSQLLQRMLAQQLRTQILITGVDPATLDPASKMDYIRTMVLACTDELHEALTETGWKPWASSNHINREAYLSELTDAWLFFMNLMLVARITPTEFFAQFEKTQRKVLNRMTNGYDGVSTKCPGCKRDYDDAGVLCTPENHEGADVTPWCEEKGWA